MQLLKIPINYSRNTGKNTGNIQVAYSGKPIKEAHLEKHGKSCNDTKNEEHQGEHLRLPSLLIEIPNREHLSIGEQTLFQKLLQFLSLQKNSAKTLGQSTVRADYTPRESRQR